MTNPFSWERLTTPPPTEEIFNPASLAYLLLFAVGFVAAAILSGNASHRLFQHPVTRRMVRRDAAIALWVFGLGLFFFGVRALGINPFSFGAPIWLWLCLLAVVVMLAYFVYYARRVQPRRMLAYQQSATKRHYLQPRAKAPSRRPSARDGARVRAGERRGRNGTDVGPSPGRTA